MWRTSIAMEWHSYLGKRYCMRLSSSGEVLWIQDGYSKILHKVNNPFKCLTFFFTCTTFITYSKISTMPFRHLVIHIAHAMNFPRETQSTKKFSNFNKLNYTEIQIGLKNSVLFQMVRESGIKKNDLCEKFHKMLNCLCLFDFIEYLKYTNSKFLRICSTL